jgi:hypothetical protein
VRPTLDCFVVNEAFAKRNLSMRALIGDGFELAFLSVNKGNSVITYFDAKRLARFDVLNLADHQCH